MITVYSASPYSMGDALENVQRSFDAALDLIVLGYAPYAPLYSHYLEERRPQAYETWLKLDLEWLKRCDCVLRLPGESKGADQEVDFAREHFIPVFFNMRDLVKEM
jgi:hypothetical protein